MRSYKNMFIFVSNISQSSVFIDIMLVVLISDFIILLLIKFINNTNNFYVQITFSYNFPYNE